MRILIATASRHGATREIGRWLSSSIVERLGSSNVTVDLRDASEVSSLAEYDAAIIGSAVYLGRWLKEARSLVSRERPALDAIPVWLFSSGPVGSSAPATSPSSWDRVPWAVEHTVFSGKLDRSALSRFERLVVSIIHADDGDERSRADVEAWAATICDTLSTTASKGSETS